MTAAMGFGLGTPIVVTPGGNHEPWERSAGIEELSQIAVAADRLGYLHLSCSEHVAVPTSVESGRGLTFWDPLALFGFLAARTTRIRFATYILVLGYHHPLAIAKRYGTLDAVSGGRLILGLGVGNLKEEFDLLGAPFEDRGDRADDAIHALRAALSRPVPTYKGKYYSFSDLAVIPHAVQPKVPIWIGGTSRRSLRRAVELGDAWSPVFLPLDKVKEMLASFDLPPGFEVVVQTKAVDPIGDRGGALAAIEALAAAGVTTGHLKVVHSSLSHYLEQIAAFAELAGLPAAPRG
jgi:probable F420-dependent oxidoreductase